MQRYFVHEKKGYAVVIVLVLLVIGTAVLVMLNRENSFFSKVAGFFNRNSKIQSQALAGIDLAKYDLKMIALNSRDSNPGTDWYTIIDGGTKTDAFNQGLYADPDHLLGTRVITPRIHRTDGDLDLKVYYFPDDPCLNVIPECPAGDDGAYNDKMPKSFRVIAQASNTKSGEIYTQETVTQLKLISYAEYALGILDAMCLDDPPPATPAACVKKFPNSTYLDFSPARYGKSYFNIDPAKLRFVMEGSDDPDVPTQQHYFADTVGFPLGLPNDGVEPFLRKGSDIKVSDGAGGYTVTGQKLPMLTFAKGYEEGSDAKVFNAPGDPHYVAANDPSTDEYFTGMESMANTNGYNLSNGQTCPGASNVPLNICLKFEGSQIKQYQCNDTYGNGAMGRVDVNVHPNDGTSAPGQFTSAIANTFPDRYVGEHAEVYNGTPAPGSSTLGSTNGVIYCHMSGCDCNIHVKGIIDGQVNVVSDNVVLEGDLVYQDQNVKDSDDVLGITAKKDIIVPAGIPQAATSAPTGAGFQLDIPLTDVDPPYSDSTPGGTPATLAESYLGITNFIPQNGGQYKDRDIGDANYKDYVGWDTSSVGEYNSPMALDIDAEMYAGRTFKIDGVYNPEMDAASTPDDIESLSFTVCNDPPTCTSLKNLSPAVPAGDPNALFKSDGTLVDSSIPGVPVQPYYYVDGLNFDTAAIDGKSGKPKYGNFNDTTYNNHEEVARPLNKLINIFGGLNAKYYYIYDKLNANNGQPFRMGFDRKIINADPRASFLTPPGYPSTLTIEIYEIYKKSYQGKSPLVP